MPAALEEVGSSLGRPRWFVHLRVTLPLLAPGLAAAFCLVFLSCVIELTTTLILIPTGSQTLSTRFWSYQQNLFYGQAGPYALAMIAIAAVPTAFLVRFFSRFDGGHGVSGFEIADLHKGFGSQPVLAGLELAAPAGSFTAILGASGSGKTTLLRVLAGFERPDRGTISIGGQSRLGCRSIAMYGPSGAGSS